MAGGLSNAALGGPDDVVRSVGHLPTVLAQCVLPDLSGETCMYEYCT